MKINCHLLRDEADVQLMRDLIERLPHETTVVGFEENMLLETVRATTRLWQQDGHAVGFAYVNDYNAIRFEIDAAHRSPDLENDVIAWGIRCMQNRNMATGQNKQLKATFKATHTWQIALLERHGFVCDEFRTLQYGRSLHNPISPHPLPSGFSLRCVTGEHEVEQLVALHRAAFGTKNMKVAHRLAIMQAPHYERELDLVAVAPNGELAAFCICGIEEGEDSEKTGFTDPIGTHPNYQRHGLAQAMVTAGLRLLKGQGLSSVQLSTGSNNMPMQRLAESLGFTCIAEKLWFSKEILQTPTPA